MDELGIRRVAAQSHECMEIFEAERNRGCRNETQVLVGGNLCELSCALCGRVFETMCLVDENEGGIGHEGGGVSKAEALERACGWGDVESFERGSPHRDEVCWCNEQGVVSDFSLFQGSGKRRGNVSFSAAGLFAEQEGTSRFDDANGM